MWNSKVGTTQIFYQDVQSTPFTTVNTWNNFIFYLISEDLIKYLNITLFVCLFVFTAIPLNTKSYLKLIFPSTITTVHWYFKWFSFKSRLPSPGKDLPSGITSWLSLIAQLPKVVSRWIEEVIGSEIITLFTNTFNTVCKFGSCNNYIMIENL